MKNIQKCNKKVNEKCDRKMNQKWNFDPNMGNFWPFVFLFLCICSNLLCPLYHILTSLASFPYCLVHISTQKFCFCIENCVTVKVNNVVCALEKCKFSFDMHFCIWLFLESRKWDHFKIFLVHFWSIFAFFASHTINHDKK